jgi:hypothetical protein
VFLLSVVFQSVILKNAMPLNLILHYAGLLIGVPLSGILKGGILLNVVAPKRKRFSTLLILMPIKVVSFLRLVI